MNPKCGKCKIGTRQMQQAADDPDTGDRYGYYRCDNCGDETTAKLRRKGDGFTRRGTHRGPRR